MLDLATGLIAVSGKAGSCIGCVRYSPIVGCTQLGHETCSNDTIIVTREYKAKWDGTLSLCKAQE